MSSTPKPIIDALEHSFQHSPAGSLKPGQLQTLTQSFCRTCQKALPHSQEEWLTALKWLAYIPSALLGPVITAVVLAQNGLTKEERAPFTHQEILRQVWGVTIGIGTFPLGGFFSKHALKALENKLGHFSWGKSISASLNRSNTMVRHMGVGIAAETIGYSARAWFLNQQLAKELHAKKKPAPALKLNVLSSPPQFAAISVSNTLAQPIFQTPKYESTLTKRWASITPVLPLLQI
jgi:hypothetical protein